MSNSNTPLLSPAEEGQRYELYSPIAMPAASAFLWNRKMMVQLNCRGYAVAQFMQPEPAKYAYAPNLEAKTFMQPEQPYYAHHPGRFFYIKDEADGSLFSAPYEPVRAKPDSFCFSAGKSDVRWRVSKAGIEAQMSLTLPVDDVVELWQFTVTNNSDRPRKLSVYPYFPVGFMSWMNQSGEYRPDLGGVVCSCVTPYQKVEDYFKNRYFKDKTFFLHDTTPDAWDVRQSLFEGEGGLHNPDGVNRDTLTGSDARYEVPAAILQYRIELAPGESRDYRFLFGPAYDDAEVADLRDRYLSADSFVSTRQAAADYVAQGRGCLTIETPDEGLNNFVNHWLPRQMFYHGDVNRLTTDPQTRNYIQDNMGMSYIRPAVARRAFLHALSQQEASGAMPDGILLTPDAELKYINQVPHTDHCVWLPVCLQAYLDETGDDALLDETVAGDSDGSNLTVYERIGRAMDWLLRDRDERGLNYIAQGDWCDPMNMVGYKGKGVSGWLSLATAYALNLWAAVCERRGDAGRAEHFRAGAREINAAVNKYLWDGQWFGRGITDDNVVFGISKDKEGRIFLNPQSWALLAGAASDEQKAAMLKAVEEQLETPYGPAMLAPAFTAMRDDVGRVTQKHPGSAENGSVYNHAAVFYIYSLYTQNETERAWRLLRQMIPGPAREDYLQRGQLPVYIPNYYRGAWYQFPRTAGRSSQLFNTGTVAWVYRCLVEGLFGLRGCPEGLRIEPQLPADWQEASVQREFRGAHFIVRYRRDSNVKAMTVTLDGKQLDTPLVKSPIAGERYAVDVVLPGG